MLRLLVFGLLVATCTARATYDESQTLSRVRRQSASLEALDLASKDKPVGKIHGKVDVNGSGNDKKNYHVQGGVGLGAKIYESDNGKHSIGAGVYGTQGKGSSYGYDYKTKPDIGGGLSYTYKFG